MSSTPSRSGTPRQYLADGSTVAVIGGGPSGAFFAIDLLRKAAARGKRINVTIIERRRSAAPSSHALNNCWRGCNYCAGGISPRLYDVLREMDLSLPDRVVQSRVQTITIQGFWKNIELEIPADRRMFSVFRGSRPSCISGKVHSFDAFLLEQAIAAGATLISGEVIAVGRAGDGKPVLSCMVEGSQQDIEADFCVFACGLNEHGNTGKLPGDPLLSCADAMMPGFAPPATRKTLIFELAARPEIPGVLRNSVFFVEYGSRELPLEMCSILPKRDCITVVLIGKAVDAVQSAADVRDLIRGFLRLSHIQRLLFPVAALEPMCVCSPKMVTGLAAQPFGDRVAAVGDMVTSRLYKDGLLSAHCTASALAAAILDYGVDFNSLKAGYGPILNHFRFNNRCAAFVFFLHRVFFSSSVLSRVLYQAVISERKTKPASDRRLESILWKIASGDDEYSQLLRCLVRPRTVCAVLTGGLLVTLRSYLTELAFGLKWEGFGRFTTGVSLERLEEKRKEFRRLVTEAHVPMPADPEFERMYTIKIAAPRELILRQLETFGERNRQYLQPRGVRIERVAGFANVPGCVIRYEILSPHFRFHLRLEKIHEGHLTVYRVLDGFARGGVLLLEIEVAPNNVCLLSIYVAFNFPHGQSWAAVLGWRGFRLLFPSFVHDVIWNHSLCQLRDLVERQVTTLLANTETGTTRSSTEVPVLQSGA